MAQPIANVLRDRRASGDTSELDLKPGLEAFNQGLCAGRSLTQRALGSRDRAPRARRHAICPPRGCGPFGRRRRMDAGSERQASSPGPPPSNDGNHRRCFAKSDDDPSARRAPTSCSPDKSSKSPGAERSQDLLASGACAQGSHSRRRWLGTLCLDNGVQVRLVSCAPTATLEDSTLLNGKHHVMNVTFYLGGRL